MKQQIIFEPLTPSLYQQYIDIGTNAYNQHYRHLWPNGDTSTYIHNSFTQKILLQEEQDNNTSLFLIKINKSYAGILKFTHNKVIGEFDKTESLYIDKIYIQKEFARMGIGRKTIEFIIKNARQLSKKVIYLESMQKGPALLFYLANDFSIIDTTKVPFENVIEEEKPMYILLKEL